MREGSTNRSLLDPCIRASEIEQFFRRKAVSLVIGEKAGKRKGLGTEFHGFKTFEYGDDARRIDWGATLRTGVLTKAELLVRTYAEEIGVPVYIVLDATGSMGYSDRKRSLSAYTASAIAHLALYSSDRLMLITFSGSGVKATRLRKGRPHAHLVLRGICLTPRRGDLAMAELGDKLKAMAKKRGLMYFVTDAFFDLGEFSNLVRLFSSLRFHVGVALVAEQWELDPPRMGFVVLRDPETGDTITLDTSGRAFRTMLERIRTKRKELAQDIREKGASSFVIKGERDAMKVIKNYVESRILVKP